MKTKSQLKQGASLGINTVEPSPLDSMPMASHLLKETPPAPEVSKVRQELLSMAKKLDIHPEDCYCKSLESLSDENLAGWVRTHVAKAAAKLDEQKEFEKALDTILYRIMRFLPWPMMIPKDRW